jgi:hypothetical protein
MSLNLRTQLIRNKLVLSLLGFFISEIICWFFVQRAFGTIKSDVLGTPLLSNDGHRTVALTLFVAIQLFLIPIWTVIILNSQVGLISETMVKISKNFKAFSADPQNYFRLFITIGCFLYLVVVSITTNLAFIQSNFNQLFLVSATLAPFCLLLALYGLKKFKLRGNKTSNWCTTTLLFSALFGVTFYVKFSNEPGILKYLFLSWPITFVVFSKSFFRFFQRRKSIISLKKTSSDLFLYLPGFVFMLYSERTPSITLNPFEDFSLSNARLLGKDFLPWQDFSVEHGIWEDLFRPYLGGMLINHSDWGSISGIQGFIRPAEYLILGICVYLLSKNLSTTIFILSINNLCERLLDISSLEIPRMIPLMVLTVILKFYLEKKSLIHLTSLGVGSGVAILWAPEGIYPVAAIILLLILLGVINHHSVANDIKYFLFYLLLLVATIIIPLTLTGLLAPWARATISNSDGYLFAWGSDFQFSLGFTYAVFAFLIPIVSLAFISLAAVNLFHFRQQNKTKYLWIFPVFFSCFAYYVKFLQWPDWHLKQPASLLIFGIICLVAPLLATRKTALSFTGLPLVMILIFSTVTSSGNDASLDKSNIFMQTAGHVSPSTEDYLRRVAAVEESFRPFLKNGLNSKILDFGNEPVTWFDLLNYQPAGSDIKMLSLASGRSQKKAIEGYKSNPPDAVIWGGEFGYWKGPINGTWMKQYLVSAFIMDNFVPVATNGGYVLLLNRQDNFSSEKARSNMMNLDCNWKEGVGRFLPPEETVSAAKLVPIKYQRTDRSHQNSEVFRMKKNSAAKGIYISAEAGNFKLQNVSGGGSIKFTLSKRTKNQLIWLDNCPTFRYSNDVSDWLLTSNPQSTNTTLKLAISRDK